MKLILQSQDDKIEISSNVSDVSEAIDLFKRALIGIGFHPDNIKKAFEKEINNDSKSKSR